MPEATAEKEEQKKEELKRPLPFGANYHGGDRDDFRRQLERELERGKLPKILGEGSRLVGAGESTEADKVISYVKGVLDRLSQASTGKPCPDLRIVLADQHGFNAGIITKADPPILLVGLGMIDEIVKNGFGEDHLAAILSHERFHFLRHRKWKDLDNGRPEETVGDVYGVIEAEKAGYNPAALGDVFKALREQQKALGYDENKLHALSQLLDEHPAFDDRIRNTELALASLQLKKRMEQSQTDIPQDILEAADAVKYTSNYEKFKLRNNFGDKTPAVQLNLLGQYFSEELDKEEGWAERHYWVKKKEGIDGDQSREGDYHNYMRPTLNPHLMTLRLCEAGKDLRSLQGKEGVSKEAYRQFRNFMQRPASSDRDHDNRAHNKWVLRRFAYLIPERLVEDQEYWEAQDRFQIGDRNMSNNNISHQYDKILPPLFLRFKTDAKAFWQAKTRGEALEAAVRYKAAEKVLEKYSSGIYALKLTPCGEHLRFPSRGEIRESIAEEGKARLPWENQVQWANDTADKAGNELILSLACQLGCYDPRLTGCPIPDHKLRSYDDAGELVFDHIHFDEEGNIVDLDYTEKERLLRFKERYKDKTAGALYEQEYRMQKEREAQERKSVAEADWSEMERDFWSFVKQYENILEPSYSVVPGHFPFAAELMKRLKHLTDTKPGQWQPVFESFLTGHNDNVTEEDKAHHADSYSGEETIKPFSFPDLCLRAGRKYFGYTGAYDNFKQEFKGKRGALPEKHSMADSLAQHADTRRGRNVSYRHPRTGVYVEYDRAPKKVPAEQELLEIPLKMDHRHPYLRAILHSDALLLRGCRRANLISHFRYYDQSTEAIEKYFKVSPRSVFNQASFNSARAFNDYSHKLERHDTNRQVGRPWHHAEAIELLKTLRRFDNKKPEKRFSISELNYWLVTETFEFLDDKELANKLHRELKKLINSQIRRNRRIDFKKSVPLKTLIKRYTEDHGSEGMYGFRSSHSVFAFRPHLEQAYQKRIRGRIMALPVSDRISSLEYLMEGQLKDPRYRNWAINEWVDARAAQMGIDHGRSAYKEEALRLIKDVTRSLETSQGMTCVVRLLDKIEAQRCVALGAKEILTEYYGQKFLEKDGAMRLIESAISTCAHDPVLRDAFLKYVTEPLTKSGTLAFSSLLKQRAGDKYNQSEFVKQFFDPEKRISVSLSQEQTIVDYLHQNLWDMPFELRTVYLDRILFPVGDDSEENFDKAVKFVLDKVLPEDSKLAKEAREALLVYLDCCPKELRRTTFSAVLATTEQSAKKGELRPGEVLSYVLTRTGAAGGQLLQASHSYLSGIEITDPDLAQFRDDLKDSKVDFDRAKRWEIFERFDKALPDEMKARIESGRVGPILGSGSTAYVVSCEQENSETALKLMREDVMPIADLQFERYAKAFEVLADRHEHYKALPGMVDSARELIKVSANGVVGKEQIDYAEIEYRDLRISINGRWYDFDVAPCLSAGAEYIETARIHGDHLNDMKAGEEKTDVSLAIETAENYRLLQGKATDKDRHGGQQGIKKRTIGMFDVGQMPYDIEKEAVQEPNATEKYALGCLLGGVFNAAAAGGNVVEAFVDSVASKSWDQAKDYLVNEQRSLLARQDVHKSLGKSPTERASNLKAIFGAALKSGQVDADIFRGLTDVVSIGTCCELLKSVISGQASVVNIQIEDGRADEESRLRFSQMAKISMKSALQRTFNFKRLNVFKNFALQGEGAANENMEKTNPATDARKIAVK